MDDDYWNTSSVKKKVTQQGIFDTDGNNTLDVSIYIYLNKLFIYNNFIYL